MKSSLGKKILSGYLKGGKRLKIAILMREILDNKRGFGVNGVWDRFI